MPSADPDPTSPDGFALAPGKTRGRSKGLLRILIALVILTIIGSAGALFFQARRGATGNYPGYLSGNGTLTFFDPLSQEGKWQNESLGYGGACQFTGGTYHMSQRESGYFSNCDTSGTFSNFAFEVQLTITQGDCGGMTFRSDDNGHFYSFRVCENGRYRVVKFNSGSDSKTLYDSSSSAIHTGLGQQNKIAAERFRHLVKNNSSWKDWASHNHEVIPEIHDILIRECFFTLLTLFSPTTPLPEVF